MGSVCLLQRLFHQVGLYDDEFPLALYRKRRLVLALDFICVLVELLDGSVKTGHLLLKDLIRQNIIDANVVELLGCPHLSLWVPVLVARVDRVRL